VDQEFGEFRRTAQERRVRRVDRQGFHAEALDGDIRLPARLGTVLLAQDEAAGQLRRPEAGDGGSNTYSVYGGYYAWLAKEYPASKNAVGILSGASVITQVDASLVAQTVKGVGGAVVYNGTYPISGVTDWTPYAETLKNHGVKGFTFYGEPEQLTALEAAMDNIGYKPDWIDANTNAYGADFISLAGKTVLSEQHNYADLHVVLDAEPDRSWTRTDS
jgi:hypothetical protein